MFVDFVVFEAPTKILSFKISYKLANPTNLYRMCFAMVQSTSEQRVGWDNSNYIAYFSTIKLTL